jgi:hypothetical protein
VVSGTCTWQVSDDRIDADNQCRLRHDAELFALRQILAEAMERLRREGKRILAEDEKAVMPDVRHAGFRILGNDNARRDVRPAVLGAVLRHRKIADVDGVALDDLLMARRAVRCRDRRNRVVEAVQHFVENRALVGLEGEQRLAARRIDAGDQRIIGAVVVEHDGRAVADVSLLHRLADVVQGDRAVNVDQLAMLAQYVEELAEVGERHFLILQ